LLHAYGIDNVILERQTPGLCARRIRAGLLERHGGLLDEVARRPRAHEGLVHHASSSLRGRAPSHRYDGAHGKTVMIYGQTEVTLDL